MRKLKITLAYDGTDFCGWQIQPNQPTIQGLLEAALSEIEGSVVKVHGSGRTDAGVHALAQVASCELANPIPLENLRRAMNRLLPDSIRVLRVEEAAAEFHARHSARAKTYEYRIWRAEICPPQLSRYVYPFPYPLDEQRMTQAAPRFCGRRDFRSLAANGGEPLESTVRTVFSSVLQREGELLTYRVRGSGFLHHMVRNIVGTLIEVGRGNLSPGDMDRILEAQQRSAAGPTAPGRGLFLVQVEYNDPAQENQGA
jgi:tRNA pseudouridine38-40 synthase